MKRTLSLAVAVGSLALWAGISPGATVDIFSSNNLTNTGFENGTNGWVLAPNGYTIQQSTAYAHSGTHSLELALSGNQSGNSNSNANASTAKLSTGGDVSGQTVTGGAWIYQPSSDPLVSPQDVELRIWYYNGSGAALSPAFSNATVLLPADPKDSWQYLTVNGTAPTGTQQVAFQVIFRTQSNPSQTTGSVYIDDATLTVPEPASVSALGLGGMALLRRRKARAVR